MKPSPRPWTPRSPPANSVKAVRAPVTLRCLDVTIGSCEHLPTGYPHGEWRGEQRQPLRTGSATSRRQSGLLPIKCPRSRPQRAADTQPRGWRGRTGARRRRASLRAPRRPPSPESTAVVPFRSGRRLPMRGRCRHQYAAIVRPHHDVISSARIGLHPGLTGTRGAVRGMPPDRCPNMVVIHPYQGDAIFHVRRQHRRDGMALRTQPVKTP